MSHAAKTKSTKRSSTPKIPTAGPGVKILPRFIINYGPRFAFGPGKAQLLEAVEQSGSITEAAKLMGMSYMRAWTLVSSLERGLAEPLVHKIRGGNSRGGAGLTETGRAMLKLYRQLESSIEGAVSEAERGFVALLPK